ncbi:hypothetical protein PGRAN_09966 [Listeria grandensis FSL F6-0971]|uniref:Uncharacterized protein n=1 Tax=Listeria grandensis FSL F6-0971 TaxID=1265819 RepID=W7B7J4_9LIST|nr:hypothetical protein [Listeria grandensis]EUJ23244.1 hypothetical protein PGRAN_09966 [Listeria grandensis FSL F6-0971]
MKKNDVSKAVRKGTIVLMAMGLAPIFSIDSVNGEASTNLPEEFFWKKTQYQQLKELNHQE